MSVIVITTPGNVYRAKNGTQWDAAPTVTGELAVTVFRPVGGAAPSTSMSPLAAFGSVEAVYLEGEAEDITPSGEDPEAPALPPKPASPWA